MSMKMTQTQKVIGIVGSCLKLKLIFILQQDVVLAAVLGVPRVYPVIFGVPSQSLCQRRAGEKIVYFFDNILITFSFEVDCR